LNVLTGRSRVEEWPRSQNRWDWFGEGIYFWEHAPERALRWAEEKARRSGSAPPAVVGAVIQLGVCFDLTNVAYTKMLEVAFGQVDEAYRAVGRRLPRNRGRDEDLRSRDRDCLVINYCLDKVAQIRFQTVRGAFWEGTAGLPRRQDTEGVAYPDRGARPGLYPRCLPAYA